MTKWQWIFRQLTGRLWLRASVFCLIGIGSALLGFWLRPYLPDEITHKIGAPAVGDILNIIASSMLAVTTFSLSIMVAAYASATSNVTPRSTKLLLADQTSQNSLSTFIGSFLFSLVGIVALKMGVYGDSGRLVLFIVTILVILFIVLTLLRWIEYLSRLGRVGQTIDMVERAAMNAVDSFNRHPYLGGKPADGYIPDSNHDAITDARIGYIQYVDMETLSRLSENLEAPIYLTVRPGAFNDSLKPLAHVGTALSQEQADSLRDCFTIGGGPFF